MNSPMSAGVFAHQGGDAGDVFQPALLQFVGDQADGDIDAVEDVADVVQDAGGHLGHAGQPRGVSQFALRFLEFLFGLLAFLGVVNGAVDSRHEPVDAVLEDVIRGATLETFNGNVFTDDSRDEQEGSLGHQLPGHLQGLETVPAGQLVIAQNDIERFLLQCRQKSSAIVHYRHVNAKTLTLQQAPHQAGKIRFVFQVKDLQVPVCDFAVYIH